MKRLLGTMFAAASLLLAGCATTIDSDVTAFHAWPADLQDKSFVFAVSDEQKDSLEFHNYEQLVRNELLRLGFTDAPAPDTAMLRVTLDYGMRTATMVVTQPLYDPLWYGSGYGRWGAVRPWGPYGPGPFYDPFWAPPVQQTAYPVYQRFLHVEIERASNARKLFEVTVQSDGRYATLPMAMPYMVRSAFAEFPGPSGVSRHVELKLDQPGQPVAPAQ